MGNKPFYLTMIEDVAGMLVGGKPAQVDADQVCDSFGEAGGSWYGVAHGDQEDLALLRQACMEALRYQSSQESSGS